MISPVNQRVLLLLGLWASSLTTGEMLRGLSGNETNTTLVTNSTMIIGNETETNTTIVTNSTIIVGNETETNSTLTDSTNATIVTSTCAETHCHRHPETGFFVHYTTCDDTSGQAVCECEFADKFGDVYPNCLGDYLDCSVRNCAAINCFNWCDKIEPAFDSEFQCNPGFADDECCKTSGCENLICNSNKRVHDSQPQCICANGLEKFGIDLGTQYITASGCAAP